MEARTGRTNAAPRTRDASWRRLRDAMLHLVVRRAGQADRPGFGDDADARLLAALARVRPANHDRPDTLAAVHEIGSDLGRHLYSKRIVEDALEEGLGLLGADLARSGLGTLAPAAVRYRAAELAYEPSIGAGAIDADVRSAFLSGLLEGALGDAFNCEVDVVEKEKHRFELVLGTGHDVNKMEGI